MMHLMCGVFTEWVACSELLHSEFLLLQQSIPLVRTD